MQWTKPCSRFPVRAPNRQNPFQLPSHETAPRHINTAFGVEVSWNLLWHLNVWHIATGVSQDHTDFIFREKNTYEPSEERSITDKQKRDKITSRDRDLYGRGAKCSVVVKALCYKSEGRGFETRWGEWIILNLPNLSGRTRPWGLLSQ
jgi:hypothetical protein